MCKLQACKSNSVVLKSKRIVYRGREYRSVDFVWLSSFHDRIIDGLIFAKNRNNLIPSFHSEKKMKENGFVELRSSDKCRLVEDKICTVYSIGVLSQTDTRISSLAMYVPDADPASNKKKRAKIAALLSNDRNRILSLIPDLEIIEDSLW